MCCRLKRNYFSPQKDTLWFHQSGALLALLGWICFTHKCGTHIKRRKTHSVLNDQQRHAQSNLFSIKFVETSAEHGVIFSKHPLMLTCILSIMLPSLVCEGPDVGSLSTFSCQLLRLLQIRVWSHECSPGLTTWSETIADLSMIPLCLNYIKTGCNFTSVFRAGAPLRYTIPSRCNVTCLICRCPEFPLKSSKLQG